MVHDANVVLDTIGGETQARSWKVLKRGGIQVSIIQPPPQETATALGVRGEFLICDHTRKDELATIVELVVRGQVKVFVATVLPLSEAREAQQISQEGHAEGKIVLRIAAD